MHMRHLRNSGHLWIHYFAITAISKWRHFFGHPSGLHTAKLLKLCPPTSLPNWTSKRIFRHSSAFYIPIHYFSPAIFHLPHSTHIFHPKENVHYRTNLRQPWNRPCIENTQLRVQNKQFQVYSLPENYFSLEQFIKTYKRSSIMFLFQTLIITRLQLKCFSPDWTYLCFIRCSFSCVIVQEWTQIYFY